LLRLGHRVLPSLKLAAYSQHRAMTLAVQAKPRIEQALSRQIVDG
jgi:hypothetical protein